MFSGIYETNVWKHFLAHPTTLKILGLNWKQNGLKVHKFSTFYSGYVFVEQDFVLIQLVEQIISGWNHSELPY